MQTYEEAAKLDPTIPDYHLAAEVARSHAVTALLQQAANAREHGHAEQSRQAIEHAAQVDPQNPAVTEHLRELADASIAAEFGAPAAPQRSPELGGPVQIMPSPTRQSFHLRTDTRSIILQVFRAYGIEANLDDSVRGPAVKFNLDNVDFSSAIRALSLATGTFYVPVDIHRVVVARDTRELRQRYVRNSLETVSLSGMNANEITEMGNLAKQIFQAPQATVDPAAATLSIRAPEQTLNAFNGTYRNLMEGRPEVMINVRLIQLAHRNARTTGAQLPQTMTAFNVYAEEQAILSQNQALVQQIIASGLASPGDTLTILGILLASGQVSSSLFSNGIALFGGGLTLSGISPGPATVNLNLNSSDSRQLDDYSLRLEDNEEGTLRSGTRYPIMTASYSSLGTNSLNIPGLTGAGTSSSLSSILASLQGAQTNVPQVQYQDLGLTLKTRPRVLRSGDVTLSLDLKITALAGSSVNGVPVLDNRSYTSVVRVPANQSVVIAGEIDKSEARALSGIPGLSEIPGLNNVTEKDLQTNYATLLIILTPRVVRMPHGLEHSPMLRVDKGTQLR